MNRTTYLATAAAMLLSSTAVSAETLRWARAGDALTLDPHAQNEGPTSTLAHQIYEPLLLRTHAGDFEGALATSWEPSAEDPNVWTFTLREGVKFHGGEDFTAEDVVFSINRAQSENSGYKELINSVVEVRATGDYTVEFVTDGPNPILPSNLTNMMMMDSGWAEANGVADVQNYDAGEETFATQNANGTGPYTLASRETDVRTVMEMNEAYWGADQFPMAVTRIEFTPIQNAATRVAALLSGEVDFIQDVPVQDLDRVENQDGLNVKTTPQNRTIFLGMNVGAADIEADDVDGANPLADRRVREAMNIAIDRNAIRQVVMRGQSTPTGVIMPPFVNGWTEELDAVTDADVERARELLTEAGYADGFSIRLDCPNDRYINDEAICQAVTGMMGRIGITVNLDAKPKAQHFPLITGGATDFYMLGWGVPTFDSEYIFNFLVHSRTDDRGSWNGTGYSNADLDAQIVSLASETDLDVRNETIASIWNTVQTEVLYLPLHHQVLNWGFSSAFDSDVSVEDQPKFKYFTDGSAS